MKRSMESFKIIFIANAHYLKELCYQADTREKDCSEVDQSKEKMGEPVAVSVKATTS